jgi:murein DD-endopeptidase MepM/ murein hydrolase activator NlpD
MYAASYRGEQVGEKRVFRYQFPNGMVSWFQQDGSSARKSFLKSPLKYTHVTSGFGNRFHPVLQYFKEHNGVDYQAAVGTPVWAVSDGTVTRAGNFGPNGNLVCLKHLNGFETCYAHLSKVMVRNGQHVSQKQVIALTGSTGRSTGPHLHFALKRSGAFLNPLNQKFPRAEPIPKDQLARYRETITPYVEKLGATDVASAK